MGLKRLFFGRQRDARHTILRRFFVDIFQNTMQRGKLLNDRCDSGRVAALCGHDKVERTAKLRGFPEEPAHTTRVI